MDIFTHSQQTLELNKIRQLLSELAQTQEAKEDCLVWPVETDEVRIRELQAQTSAAKEMQSVKGLPPFGGLTPSREIVDRAEKGACLSTGELLHIAGLLQTTRSVLAYKREGKGNDNCLSEIFERLLPNRPLEDRIRRSIIAEDQLADDASPELAEIRRKIHFCQNKIREVLTRYTTTQSKYLQEALITTRDGRYVLPVKAEYRSEIKGLVHDTSSSGSTLFVEPMAVVELNNDIREWESKEKAEIERILYQLSADTAAFGTALQLNDTNLSFLASIFARSELSFRMNAREAVFTDERKIVLNRARHPLIDPKKVVPISLTLGGDQPMMVITGPNTGGKTVTLKTIGLLSLMAQCGLHVPCEEGSLFCVFDTVCSDIGDEQSIEQSLSTFSSHMTSVVRILETITENSLVLFDELGAGTDPVEGAALATSILENVLSVGALCGATTHYSELKAFAIEEPRAFNASCEFDVETLKPTYRLIIGAPGKSNAFAISSKLGLPSQVIERAEQLLNEESRDFEKIISELETSRRVLDKEIEEARRGREEFEAFRRKSEDDLRKRLGSAEKDARQMRDQAQQTLDSARVTSQYIMSQLEDARKELESEKAAEKLNAKKKAIRDRIAEYSNQNTEETDDAEYTLPRELVKGDLVQHRNLGVRGTVLEAADRKGLLNVQFGNIRMRVSPSDLRLLDEAMKEEKIKAKMQEKNRKTLMVKNFKPELDIRGQTADDGWFMLNNYIDEARFAGVHSVTCIHGKGTGALRNALWKMLKTDKRVVSFRAGQFGEGDYGVTVIELKP